MKQRQRSGRMVKVNWLLEHPQLWEHLGPTTSPLVFAEMQEAGLYSKETRWSDAGVATLINRAREIRRNMARAEAEAALPRRVQETLRR